VQFAIKVTLAGMLSYLFYTASDYYGIHTVFYTPLIIALASTGATIHKGFLQGYGPSDSIDPLRDRFIGIVIGICIVTTVFAVIWPESADSRGRERLADCLRTIARLLRLGGIKTVLRVLIRNESNSSWK
jgi:uncharacterized membrane protein YccC